MKTISALASAALLLSYAGVASATHKAWFLKNGAAECAWLTPLAGDNLQAGGPIANWTTNTRTVICPVALANRWGGTASGVPFNPIRWADALSGVVYTQSLFDTGSISCSAAMQSSNGSMFFSGSAATGAGSEVKRIYLGDHGQWAAGGTLEANESLTVRSLNYVCTLPPNGNMVYGYRVKICQLTGDCDNELAGVETEDDVDLSGSAPEHNVVQTSGIECSPIEGGMVATYTPSGITPVSGATRRVYCPIAPPSDDSVEHHRQVRFTRVYYSGGSNASGCVAAGTCPSCALRWFDRAGLIGNGPVFTEVFTEPGLMPHVSQPSPSQAIGLDLQVGVRCTVPANVTIMGVKSAMSTTAISMGQ